MSITEESFDLLKRDRDMQRRARASRMAGAALWSGLLLFGVKQRGVVGLAAMAISLQRLYRMFSSEGRSSYSLPASRQPWWSAPSKAPEADWDSVDEALCQTFPASDPPGHFAPSR